MGSTQRWQMYWTSTMKHLQFTQEPISFTEKFPGRIKLSFSMNILFFNSRALWMDQERSNLALHVGAGDKKTFIWANIYASENPPYRREEWNQGSIRELDEILLKYPHSHPMHRFAELTGKNDLLHFWLYYHTIKRHGLGALSFWFRETR